MTKRSKPVKVDNSKVLETIMGDKFHWIQRGLVRQTLPDEQGDPIYRYSMYRGNVVIDFYDKIPEAVSVRETVSFQNDMAILLKGQLCINTADNLRNTLLDLCLHKYKSRKLFLEGYVNQVYYSISINPEIFSTQAPTHVPTPQG